MRIATAATAVALIAGTAAADFTGIEYREYSVTAIDFDGSSVSVDVIDVYMRSNDSSDTLLNIYNTDFDLGNTNFFQSFTGTGWLPTNLGGPFDTEALQIADSFVTIGGFDLSTDRPPQAPGSGEGSGLDPNFGGGSACRPGANAGWFNSSPPSYNGAATPSPLFPFNATLVGRFCLDIPFDLSLSTLEMTANWGLGSPGYQRLFTVRPLIDCNGNGISDEFEFDAWNSEWADCNGNGLPDTCDIGEGASADCDADGTPDECQNQRDCDGDGVLDACEIADGAPDCNGNGIPDTCDLADGTSTDYDADGLPDDCEGGATTFFDEDGGPPVPVSPQKGAALCFWQSFKLGRDGVRDAALAPVHEGSPVTGGGAKLAVRSDVLYAFPVDGEAPAASR